MHVALGILGGNAYKKQLLAFITFEHMRCREKKRCLSLRMLKNTFCNRFDKIEQGAGYQY